MAAGNLPEHPMLANEFWRVRVAPELGGGIALAQALTPAGPTPVLRAGSEKNAGVFDLASNLLVPFSNRISGGGFFFDGTFHPVAPNLNEDPFPIHGDGFQKPWTVQSKTENSVHMDLDQGAIGPYRYSAKVHYQLSGHDLICVLEMTNTGPALPFGGGFHPWFPRHQDTMVSFVASEVWLEDRVHLPTTKIPIAGNPDWNFASLRPLPRGLINNAFVGWDGIATIEQPSLGIVVEVKADPALGVAIVYSPDDRADFFCLEPVSHAVDAHNQPGQPGLVHLATGDTLALQMCLTWRPFEQQGHRQ